MPSANAAKDNAARNNVAKENAMKDNKTDAKPVKTDAKADVKADPKADVKSKTVSMNKPDTSQANKPGLIKGISIGVLMSLMFMLVFILVYQSFVDMTPKAVIGEIADSTYNHASRESVFSFFNALAAKCTQMNDMMTSFGVENPSSAQLKDALSKSGLDAKEQESLVKFYDICGLKDDDNKVYFDRIIDYGMTLFIGKDAVESKSAFMIFLTKNMGKVPDSNMAGVANNLSTALWLVDVVFSVRNVIIGIVVLAAAIIFLSFGYWAYLLKKFSKHLIGLGLSLVVPFIVVSFILANNPINTSFGFQGMSTMFSGAQFSLSNYGEDLMTTIVLMTLEIFYPMDLAIAGAVIFLAGIALLITVNVLIKKGKISPA